MEVSHSTIPIENRHQILDSVEDVIKSGLAHGATRQDLFGCLYFHVSDTLREFTDRLSRFNIKFKMFCDETTKLSHALRSDALRSLGLPATVRFDRIEVSNIMDRQYLGISRTMDAWGRFLKADDATLIGYFMDWVRHQPGGVPDASQYESLEERLRDVIDVRVLLYDTI